MLHCLLDLTRALLIHASGQVLGLNYLHRLGIVHHDIKPHNVFVTAKGHCVIADYGGVRFMGPDRKLTRDGESLQVMTRAYAAPELLKPLGDDQLLEYDERVDYWSLAATVVSLIMDDVRTANLPHLAESKS